MKQSPKQSQFRGKKILITHPTDDDDDEALISPTLSDRSVNPTAQNSP